MSDWPTCQECLATVFDADDWRCEMCRSPVQGRPTYADLRALVARLAEVLCRVERGPTGHCPRCGTSDPHYDDCELDQALTAAGYGPEERRRVRDGR